MLCGRGHVFDDIDNSLPDIDLSDLQMDSAGPVFWADILDSALPLKTKTNIQINWDGLRDEINNFRDSFKSLSTLYDISLIKIEAALDEHDMNISRLVSNVGFNSTAAADAGFVSVWDAIKELQEQVGATQLSAELAQVEAQVASTESSKALVALKINNSDQVKLDLSKDLDDLLLAFQTSLGPPITRAESLYNVLSSNVGSPPGMALEPRLSLLENTSVSAPGLPPNAMNRFQSGINFGSLGTGIAVPPSVMSTVEDNLRIHMDAVADRVTRVENMGKTTAITIGSYTWNSRSDMRG